MCKVQFVYILISAAQIWWYQVNILKNYVVLFCMNNRGVLYSFPIRQNWSHLYTYSDVPSVRIFWNQYRRVQRGLICTYVTESLWILCPVFNTFNYNLIQSSGCSSQYKDVVNFLQSLENIAIYGLFKDSFSLICFVDWKYVAI